MAKSSPSSLGVGIIGSGLMGGIHAECYAREKDCRLQGYYNPTRSKAEALAKRFGGKVHDSVASLLADPAIAAVSIASPQSAHRDQAVAAVRAGKHVLCEKPLALTLAEMDQIAKAVRAKGVTFMVGHQMRFHPVVRAVRDAMAKLGPVFSLDLEWAFRITATSGRCWATYREGGFFMELGCHAADLARFLMGPIRDVQANTLRMNHARLTEDFTRCLLQFDTFASGSIVISANHRTTRQGLLRGRVMGERGRIDFTCYPYARAHNRATLVLDKGKEIFVPDETRREIAFRQPRSLFKVYPGFYDVYQQEVRAFLDAIATGSAPPCTLEDGRSAVEVVLAIYDQQARATVKPNFAGRKRAYRGDKASHPGLKRGGK